MAKCYRVLRPTAQQQQVVDNLEAGGEEAPYLTPSSHANPHGHTDGHDHHHRPIPRPRCRGSMRKLSRLLSHPRPAGAYPATHPIAITTMAVTLPTIHLNGTGAQALEKEYRAVREAVDTATLVLERATCNARDFYPQEPAAWQRALSQRAEAFRLLQLVSEYAEQWETHAADARRARARD
jgi:hypothetical protein